MRGIPMKGMQSIFIFLLVLTCSSIALAHTDRRDRTFLVVQRGMAGSQQRADRAALDSQGDKYAIQAFLKSVLTQIVSSGDTMPSLNHAFVPNDAGIKAG